MVLGINLELLPAFWKCEDGKQVYKSELGVVITGQDMMAVVSDTKLEQDSGDLNSVRGKDSILNSFIRVGFC